MYFDVCEQKRALLSPAKRGEVRNMNTEQARVHTHISYEIGGC